MSKAKIWSSEADIGFAVVAQLRAGGWDVYQEVDVHRAGARADLVATKDGNVEVVECKMTMSLDLLGQAENWLTWAHRVSVALPMSSRRTRGYDFAVKAMKKFGIGSAF